MLHHLHTGKMGEQLAANYLYEAGYTILHRNWRHRHWEVDIIACRGNRLHFVEVKTRQNLSYGLPEESITKEKCSTCAMRRKPTNTSIRNGNTSSSMYWPLH